MSVKGGSLVDIRTQAESVSGLASGVYANSGGQVSIDVESAGKLKITTTADDAKAPDSNAYDVVGVFAAEGGNVSLSASDIAIEAHVGESSAKGSAAAVSSMYSGAHINISGKEDHDNTMVFKATGKDMAAGLSAGEGANLTVTGGNKNDSIEIKTQSEKTSSLGIVGMGNSKVDMDGKGGQNSLDVEATFTGIQDGEEMVHFKGGKGARGIVATYSIGGNAGEVDIKNFQDISIKAKATSGSNGWAYGLYAHADDGIAPRITIENSSSALKLLVSAIADNKNQAFSINNVGSTVSIKGGSQAGDIIGDQITLVGNVHTGLGAAQTSITTGAGNDLVGIQGKVTTAGGGKLTIDTGAGNDVVNVTGGIDSKGHTIINTGSGEDMVNIGVGIMGNNTITGDNLTLNIATDQSGISTGKGSTGTNIIDLGDGTLNISTGTPAIHGGLRGIDTYAGGTNTISAKSINIALKGDGTTGQGGGIQPDGDGKTHVSFNDKLSIDISDIIAFIYGVSSNVGGGTTTIDGNGSGVFDIAVKGAYQTHGIYNVATTKLLNLESLNITVASADAGRPKPASLDGAYGIYNVRGYAPVTLENVGAVNIKAGYHKDDTTSDTTSKAYGIYGSVSMKDGLTKTLDVAAAAKEEAYALFLEGIRETIINTSESIQLSADAENAFGIYTVGTSFLDMLTDKLFINAGSENAQVAVGMQSGEKHNFNKDPSGTTITANQVDILAEGTQEAYGMKAINGGINTIQGREGQDFTVNIVVKSGADSAKLYAMFAESGGKNSIIGNSTADSSDRISITGDIHAADGGVNEIKTGSGNDIVYFDGTVEGDSLSLKMGDGYDTLVLKVGAGEDFNNKYLSLFEKLLENNEHGIEVIRLNGADASALAELKELLDAYNSDPQNAGQIVRVVDDNILRMDGCPALFDDQGNIIESNIDAFEDWYDKTIGTGTGAGTNETVLAGDGTEFTSLLGAESLARSETMEQNEHELISPFANIFPAQDFDTPVSLDELFANARPMMPGDVATPVSDSSSFPVPVAMEELQLLLDSGSL